MPGPAQPDSPDDSLDASPDDSLDASRAAGAGDQSMSVLVLVGDALRRDALAMQLPAGGPSAFTSRLDHGWIRFDRCYAAAPWTLPASTSLLTATDPLVHEHWSHRHTLAADSLVPEFPTAHRAAVINNSVLRRMAGLSAGFEPYLWISDTTESFAAASEFLRERTADGASYFLMVHSNLPHDYYLPDAQRAYEHWFPERHDFAPIGYRVLAWKGVVREQARMRRTYDASVLRLHEGLDALLEAAPLDRTIVLVLADHGEGFEPELARIHHGGRVHDDLVRVPCALWLPPNVPPSVRTQLAAVAAGAGAVGVVDLLPTLLGLLGRDVTPGRSGRDLSKVIDGSASASAEHRVLRIEDRRYLYLASRLRLNTNAQGKNMSRVAKLRNRAWRATVAKRHVLQGFVDGRWKLVVTEFVAPSAFAARAGSWRLAQQHNGHPFVVVRGRSWFGFELFDVDTDPGERTNRLLGRGSPNARGDLGTRLLATVDAYRAGDLTPHLADLASPGAS
ncbi:MAG TPA: sulfatase-like hydrolase/transferase [Acidimicrobiia bacterium]